MKKMYFNLWTTDAFSVLDWCWMEWLVHQTQFSLGGLIEVEKQKETPKMVKKP